MGRVLKQGTDGPRLNSWKEIAAFFDCTERTVRRWEQDRGLPIHRLPGSAGGKVYAYAAELKQWLEAPNSTGATAATEAGTERATAEPVGATPSTGTATDTGDTAKTIPEAAVLRAEAAAPTAPGAPAAPTTSRWLLAVVVVVLVGAGWAGFRTLRIASAGATRVAAGKGRHKPSPEAEDFYLKGRYYWNLRTSAGLTHAVDDFTQAIVHDPAYAEAYGGLADCYNLMREYTVMPANEAYPKALAAAQKAVELDDGLADADASLGFVLFYWKWDAAGAEREFRRAIALDPNNVNAHHWYATMLSTERRNAEALAEIEWARKLAPDSKSILADKGTLLSCAGRNDEAVALLQQMVATEPEFVSLHRYLVGVYFGMGDYPRYLAESRKVAELMHDDAGMTMANAAEAGYKENGRQGLLEALLEAQQRLFEAGRGDALGTATSAAMLGKNEEALHYLQIAHDQHDSGFPYIYMSERSAFATLRSDGRYQALVRTVFPEATF